MSNRRLNVCLRKICDSARGVFDHSLDGDGAGELLGLERNGCFEDSCDHKNHPRLSNIDIEDIPRHGNVKIREKHVFSLHFSISNDR